MYKVLSAFEQDNTTYKAGDNFPLPSEWKEDMQNFDGQGIRFVKPYFIEGNKSWQWVILPVAKVEEEKAAKPKEK